jgi:hypothetical protein
VPATATASLQATSASSPVQETITVQDPPARETVLETLAIHEPETTVVEVKTPTAEEEAAVFTIPTVRNATAVQTTVTAQETLTVETAPLLAATALGPTANTAAAVIQEILVAVQEGTTTDGTVDPLRAVVVPVQAPPVHDILAAIPTPLPAVLEAQQVLHATFLTQEASLVIPVQESTLDLAPLPPV